MLDLKILSVKPSTSDIATSYRVEFSPLMFRDSAQAAFEGKGQQQPLLITRGIPPMRTAPDTAPPATVRFHIPAAVLKASQLPLIKAYMKAKRDVNHTVRLRKRLSERPAKAGLVLDSGPSSSYHPPGYAPQAGPSRFAGALQVDTHDNTYMPTSDATTVTSIKREDTGDTIDLTLDGGGDNKVIDLTGE